MINNVSNKVFRTAHKVKAIKHEYLLEMLEQAHEENYGEQIKVCRIEYDCFGNLIYSWAAHLNSAEQCEDGRHET